MIVYGQISCICLHANEGRESKTKDSVNNMHLNIIFIAFSLAKKCPLYTGKYGISDCRNSGGELSSTELDLVILGMIQSTINCDEAATQEEQRK